MKPERGLDAELLGLFGGTFDPIHPAHLHVADAAWQACGLSALRWIPAGQPPHRSAPQANAEHRLAMVRLAISGRAGESVDPREALSHKKSYTVSSLRSLREEIGPQHPTALILGADAFLGLASWYQWEELFSLTHLVLTQRPGYSLASDKLPGPLAEHYQQRLTLDARQLKETAAGKIFIFPITQSALSATMIRAQIKAGESLASLLPKPVLDYIRLHHLYT